MTFAEPLALLLLLPVAVAALRRRLPGGRLPGAWRQVVDPFLQPVLAAGIVDRRGSQTKRALVTATLLVVALARPLVDFDKRPDYANLAGRVIVLDLHKEAPTSDVRIVAARLIESVPPVPTALVGVAGEAYTVVPFTTDRRHLARYLQAAAPELMPVPGRALHIGLAHAETVLKGAGISIGQIVLASGGAAPAPMVDLASSGTRRVVLPVSGHGWQAFAQAYDAELVAPDRLSDISSGLERAVARKLSRSAAGEFTNLAPWLTGGAMLLWLGFFRRRAAP
ncbi:MAG: hypothetical protein OXF51_04520 [Alphaproteobacteria bacterium]|nr:hypothetical protein [Alphaproteobacteria bacterium]